MSTKRSNTRSTRDQAVLDYAHEILKLDSLRRERYRFNRESTHRLSLKEALRDASCEIGECAEKNGKPAGKWTNIESEIRHLSHDISRDSLKSLTEIESELAMTELHILSATDMLQIVRFISRQLALDTGPIIFGRGANMIIGAVSDTPHQMFMNMDISGGEWKRQLYAQGDRFMFSIRIDSPDDMTWFTTPGVFKIIRASFIRHSNPGSWLAHRLFGSESTFVITGYLGKGEHGVVVRVKDDQDKRDYAVKLVAYNPEQKDHTKTMIRDTEDEVRKQRVFASHGLTVDVIKVFRCISKRKHVVDLVHRWIKYKHERDYEEEEEKENVKDNEQDAEEEEEADKEEEDEDEEDKDENEEEDEQEEDKEEEQEEQDEEEEEEKEEEEEEEQREEEEKPDTKIVFDQIIMDKPLYTICIQMGIVHSTVYQWTQVRRQENVYLHRVAAAMVELLNRMESVGIHGDLHLANFGLVAGTKDNTFPFSYRSKKTRPVYIEGVGWLVLIDFGMSILNSDMKKKIGYKHPFMMDRIRITLDTIEEKPIDTLKLSERIGEQSIFITTRVQKERKMNDIQENIQEWNAYKNLQVIHHDLMIDLQKQAAVKGTKITKEWLQEMEDINRELLNALTE